MGIWNEVCTPWYPLVLCPPCVVLQPSSSQSLSQPRPVPASSYRSLGELSDKYAFRAHPGRLPVRVYRVLCGPIGSTVPPTPAGRGDTAAGTGP